MAAAQQDNHTRRNAILVLNSVLIVLSVVAVGLRFWARRIRKVPLFIDDYLIIAGLLTALGINALLYQALHVGLGRHEFELSKATVQAYALNLYMLELCWNTAMPLIKLSILLFLKRLFPVGFVGPVCNGLMVFVMLWFLAFQIVSIFQCIPIDQAWLHEPGKGHCISFVLYGTAAAATNLATDVCLLALPMTQIWKLQMRTGKKIGVHHPDLSHHARPKLTPRSLPVFSPSAP
jgi:hypothetical protein